MELQNSVKFAHPRSEKLMYLFTDACDLQWSGMLTQIPKEDFDLAFTEQHHEPLDFICGSFTGSQCRWYILEEKATEIVYSVETGIITFAT